MKDLTQGRPLKLLLLFSLPILIGNLFNVAYSLADTRIVGSFVGNNALAAVGSVSALNDLLLYFLIGVANGFAVISATYFGMNDKDSVRRVFSHALLFGMLITILIVLGCFLFMHQILGILNVSSEQYTDSYTYICIILVGLIFSSFYNILAGILRSIGDAFTPLFFLILAVALNIGLDLLFVAVLPFGVAGAAWATVFSQAISALSCFIYTWIKYPFLHVSRKDFRPDILLLKKLLPAGFSMGLMSCLVYFGTVTLQTAINSLGTNTIVAHAATRKLFSLLITPYVALATAMSTFTGQNYGAKRLDRVKSGLKGAMLISVFWALVCLLIAYTLAPMLIQAITGTSIQEVIDLGSLYQRVNIPFFLITASITLLRNMLQGLGDRLTPIVSSGIELVGKVVIALTLTPIIGYWAIILSEPIVWIIMVIPLIISSAKRLRRTN